LSLHDALPIFGETSGTQAFARKILSDKCDTEAVQGGDEERLGVIRPQADFVAVFTIRFGDHVIDDMDHMHLNDAGLVDSMTVAWRPLPAVVAVQQKLAPKLGGKAMMLVSANQAELIAPK
ncbi:MAG: hypothetical protein JO312_16665, partial [Hyphomicrobiales bacterium]|nr:hypothetical protein [Hyphomicrobiales bacterium]